jgi:hypothetical protein
MPSFKRIMFKSLGIALACTTSIIALLSLPVFLIVSLLKKSISFLEYPFIILDLKTIIVFIIES